MDDAIARNEPRPFNRGQRTWSSPSFRMEVWATILGAEIATVTIALACYDWRLLLSPLP